MQVLRSIKSYCQCLFRIGGLIAMCSPQDSFLMKGVNVQGPVHISEGQIECLCSNENLSPVGVQDDTFSMVSWTEVNATAVELES